MEIKAGEYVRTPRFLNVNIEAVLNAEQAARLGFKEPTHYKDDRYDIFGRHIGLNLMIFAAVLKPGAVLVTPDDVRTIAPPLTDEQAALVLEHAGPLYENYAGSSLEAVTSSISELFEMYRMSEEQMAKRLMEKGLEVGWLEDENDPSSLITDYTRVTDGALADGWMLPLINGECCEDPAYYYKVESKEPSEEGQA